MPTLRRPSSQLSAVLPPGATPTAASVLETLPEPRLLDLCRIWGADVRDRNVGRTKLAPLAARHVDDALPVVLRELGRDELRAVCRRHGLDASSSSRADLQANVLTAAGLDPKAATVRPPPHAEGLPQKGQVVHARRRQWLVEDVVEGEGKDSPLVRLVCLDDDDPGRPLDILWSLELGARIIEPASGGLGEVQKLDPPAHFGAFLHALAWSTVSAADATRFQAPFRAGIKIMAHQLTPLMKALELPRANLFIADDVGLGKTIEAGLVLQELILRQQASFVLVVCPASVTLQWKDEMQRRFGLRFEVMTRQFVSYRRQERGFGTNPWSTHNRFIISHALLRRPEYRDPLLALLGDRARKGLLIFDEAHAAAPASASKYAVDTEITHALRDLAPRFDNRLFLSATPHNGHSNSFSALLEILDPVRFTRGVPVEGKKDLAPVMVRRLKRDLRKLGVETFPRRLLVRHTLTHKGTTWSAAPRSYDAESQTEAEGETTVLGEGEANELVLSEMLRRYTELCAPASGQGRLPFLHLQQRLLSSPEAFAKTLEAHAKGVLDRGGVKVAATAGKKAAQTLFADETDTELHGDDEDDADAEDRAVVERASAALADPSEEARKLLADMRTIATRAQRRPDAKTLSLIAWIRENMCPAVGLTEGSKASKEWAPKRLIIFTEYTDTKRYLQTILEAACASTDRGEARIGVFVGGMGDETRAERQREFNAPPEVEPLRILIATDAAREGVNLQAYCADLFHFDLPWNPSRLEQRNGRIDRTLQPADVVRCHYFFYPDRVEDEVLAAVVRKVDVVQRELGSLGAVVLEQLEKTLAGGITKKTAAKVETIDQGAKTATSKAELEDARDDLEAVREEVHRAGARLEASRKALEVHPDSLRGVVDVGLALAGAPALAPAATTSDGRPTFALPALDETWERTLDTLRSPRTRDESFYDWRRRPLKAVTFHPLATLTEEAEQLHLAHPFVKRVLDRFLAQGFGAHDLSRVTAVVAPDESVVRVVAFARLTLFGDGAARLHDQLVTVAAPWSGDAAAVVPYRDRETARTAVTSTQRLLAQGARAPNATVQARVLAHANALFSALWAPLEAEADAVGTDTRSQLAARARREADDLRTLLRRQGRAIEKAQGQLGQLQMFETQEREQKRQVELDLKHLARRREAAARELETEPQAIEALYEVKMTRLTPVGLVVAWPEAML